MVVVAIVGFCHNNNMSSKKRKDAPDPIVFVVVAMKTYQRPVSDITTRLDYQHSASVSTTLERARRVSDALIAAGWDTAEIFEMPALSNTIDPSTALRPSGPNWKKQERWTQNEVLRNRRRSGRQRNVQV
jgi:hypothetical protein